MELIFVNRRPYRVFDTLPVPPEQHLLSGYEPEFHEKLAESLIERVKESKDEHATLGLRLLYGLAQETFFGWLFAVMQAPRAPSAWLSLYNNNDLRELIVRFQAGEDLPNFTKCRKPGSWELLPELLLPECLTQSERQRVRQLGLLWGQWASEQLDVRSRNEFNSLKHGMRARMGSMMLMIAGTQIEGEEHGSFFVNYSRKGPDLLARFNSRSWSGLRLFAHIQLMTMSISNLVTFLRGLHHIGDTSRYEYRLPNADELDRAAVDKPLEGFDFGPTWNEHHQPLPIDLDKALEVYRKLSRVPSIRGQREDEEAAETESQEPGAAGE